MSRRARPPRVVIVSRATPYEELVRRHATPGQARFYLETRGESIEPHLELHERFEAALSVVESAIPPECRRAHVDRSDLDHFLFTPDDIVVIIGQDGLVANTAKYLDGQAVIGVNPDPASYDGVLCRHEPEEFEGLFDAFQCRPGDLVEARTMVEARRDDGAVLRALNEIFVGHRSHQSARYRIRVSGRAERQSSSGLLCASGTGATGWARSIAEQRRLDVSLPAPADRALAWFVREPFPSVATRTSLDFGILEAGESIEIASEMGMGGVVFGDGIESDSMEFGSGSLLVVTAASVRLHLVADRRQPARV